MNTKKIRRGSHRIVSLKEKLLKKYRNLAVDKTILPLTERLETLGLVIRKLRKLWWIQQAKLPVARDGLGVTYTNKKIYAIGGRSDFNEDSLVQSTTSFVDEYDPDKDTWISRKKMIYPHTHQAVVTESNGKIYSLGGYIKFSMETQSDPQYTILAIMGSISDMVQQYDPVKNEWKLMNRMPLNRVFHQAVATNNGFIYVVGGVGYNFTWPDPNHPSNQEPKIKYLDDVQRYTPKTDIWESMAPMPTARYGLAVVLGKDGLIYAIGGINSQCKRVATVEVYNPSANSWSQVTDMPTPRSDLSAVVSSDGKIYAIGGVADFSTIKTVEIYDPKSDEWAIAEPITIDRLCFGATITENDLIYVIGGSQHNSDINYHHFISSVEKCVL
ncbi:MAG: hypothetical protein GY718_15965 [Lentisphaerae bacterium]|nr:hypothetical protein [Lentisphaerota bacterium]